MPVNISGHALWFTLKVDPANTDVQAALQVSTTLPSDASSAAGIGYLTVPSTSADDVAPGRYYCDIQWVQPGSPPIVTTILAGRARVLADITIATA